MERFKCKKSALFLCMDIKEYKKCFWKFMIREGCIVQFKNEWNMLLNQREFGK